MGLFDKIVASVSYAANGAKEAIKESIEEEKKRKQEREDAVGKFLNAKTEPWFTSFKFSEAKLVSATIINEVMYVLRYAV